MSLTWLQDFKKPINIIFLLIAAVSLVFAIWSLPRTQAPRQIGYDIVTEDVVSYGQKTVGVGLYDEGHKIIDGDVYVADVAIWNSGSSSITSNDVYRPVKFELFDRGRILSIYKLAELEPGVTKMQATLASDKEVTFGWDTLDLKMGAKFRITYISFDRAARLRSWRLFPAIFRNRYSTDISGFVREGEIVDAGESGRTMLKIALLLFGAASLALILLKGLAGIFSRTKYEKGLTILNRTKKYVAIVVFLGVLMSIATVVYFIFLTGIPRALS